VWEELNRVLLIKALRFFGLMILVFSSYVPLTGKDLQIKVIDISGQSSLSVVRLQRVATSSASVSFDQLNPIKKKARKNPDAIALIVGLERYERTTAQAIYADSDAATFHDYAALKLGVPEDRITTLLNEKAQTADVLLSVKSWLARSVKPGQSDVYIFFAGHGLGSEDGEQMYLLTYDGAPELLEDTAISRERIFADISSANPRSVTVFLDACYSGSTRGTETLIASRPIFVRTKKQEIPNGFTIFNAAGGTQTAKPLEEAKHGMFSYFLMKGMEGDADSNGDNQITAAELHGYVEQNVIQQSGGSQTPELQGDANRVLVRFE